MPRPVRLKLSRAKGFSLQALSLATNGLPAVNVARPSIFGNICACRWPTACPKCPEFDAGPWHGSPPACCVELYRQCLTQIASGKDTQTGSFAVALEADAGHPHIKRALTGLPMLAGRNLACWCSLGKPCHADVLLEYANKDRA